jgi:predicted nuclease of predicted toxin-antitoxin system
MKLYLDDDSASALLQRLLQVAGHDVQVPAEVGLSGQTDTIHVAHAINQDRVCLTRNYRDFEHLHLLILQARGHHPGILVVRRDNDPRRNLSPRDIVRAIRNLEAAGVSLPDRYVILNHWQ